MKKTLPLLLICLFMTSSSYAGSTFSGMYDCGVAIDGEKNDDEWMEVAITKWFQGFYSAANWQTSYTTDTTPNKKSIYYAIIKYCKENPLKDTGDASIVVYKKLTNN